MQPLLVVFWFVCDHNLSSTKAGKLFIHKTVFCNEYNYVNISIWPLVSAFVCLKGQDDLVYIIYMEIPGKI